MNVASKICTYVAGGLSLMGAVSCKHIPAPLVDKALMSNPKIVKYDSALEALGNAKRAIVAKMDSMEHLKDSTITSIRSNELAESHKKMGLPQ